MFCPDTPYGLWCGWGYSVVKECVVSSTSVLELLGINDGLKEQLDESRSRLSDLHFSFETAQADNKELVTVRMEAVLLIGAVVEIQHLNNGVVLQLKESRLRILELTSSLETAQADINELMEEL